MIMGSLRKDEELNLPLLEKRKAEKEEVEKKEVKERIWRESKKLWHIVGPSIFCRVAVQSMNVVTQAFAGHLGDVELASVSIANTVLVGFNFSLALGMASALETLCGQAYGAKKYNMLGIYMQRSWIVLFLSCFLLLPVYIFASPILKLLGQPDDVAEQTGVVALWMIPMHFSFAFLLPTQRYLQSQLKTGVLAWVSGGVLVFHVVATWLCTQQFGFGLVGIAVTLDLSWWLLFVGFFGYTAWGGCPETWGGFSVQAFSGLWEYAKLSISSGVMVCLENWYYRILILMSGNLKDATTAVDALSVCMNINAWEMTIPLAFLAATGVRVANELGSGNGKAAKFTMWVSVVQSTVIGLFFCLLIAIFHDKFALIFTSSPSVIEAVDKLSFLLAVTVLLNSVQPVLSGVAIGAGWQAKVAYVNLGCYYLIGVPLGILLGWVDDKGVQGIWGGMIYGGTGLQTAILLILTLKCDWEKEAEKASMHVEKWSSLSKQQSTITSA